MTLGSGWADSTRVCHVPHDYPVLPEFTTWPTFPFEGDLRVRTLDPAASVEPPRQGEDPATCASCLTPDDGYLWVSARWRVRSLDRPTGLPMVLILESRSHLDLGDLPNLLAAELGVMTVRLERAIRSLDGVARVHVNRWGDGSAHLHLWFLARPFGRLQLRGTFLSLWDDILPPVPEELWRENLAYVGAWLAEFGGRSMVEAPHIDWQSPSSLDGPEADGELVGALAIDADGGALAPNEYAPEADALASDHGAETTAVTPVHRSSVLADHVAGVDGEVDGEGVEPGPDLPASADGTADVASLDDPPAVEAGDGREVVVDVGSARASEILPPKKAAKRAASPRKAATPKKSATPRKAPGQKAAVAPVAPVGAASSEGVIDDGGATHPTLGDPTEPVIGARTVSSVLPPDPGDPDEQWLDDDRTTRLPADEVGTEGSFAQARDEH
jgi:hypothetical protein